MASGRRCAATSKRAIRMIRLRLAAWRSSVQARLSGSAMPSRPRRAVTRATRSGSGANTRQDRQRLGGREIRRPARRPPPPRSGPAGAARRAAATGARRPCRSAALRFGSLSISTAWSVTEVGQRAETNGPLGRSAPPVPMRPRPTAQVRAAQSVEFFALRSVRVAVDLGDVQRRLGGRRLPARERIVSKVAQDQQRAAGAMTVASWPPGSSAAIAPRGEEARDPTAATDPACRRRAPRRSRRRRPAPPGPARSRRSARSRFRAVARRRARARSSSVGAASRPASGGPVRARPPARAPSRPRRRSAPRRRPASGRPRRCRSRPAASPRRPQLGQRRGQGVPQNASAPCPTKSTAPAQPLAARVAASVRARWRWRAPADGMASSFSRLRFASLGLASSTTGDRFQSAPRTVTWASVGSPPSSASRMARWRIRSAAVTATDVSASSTIRGAPIGPRPRTSNR